MLNLDRVRTKVLWLIVLLALACGGTVQATGIVVRNVTGPETAEPARTPTKMPAPRQTPSPPTAQQSQLFQIGRQTTSPQEALDNILLSLRTARLTDEELILRVALVNTTEQQFSITGSFDERHTWLMDVDGVKYDLLRTSDNLKSISPPDGFAPGGANVGDLVFQRPAGQEPYVLNFLSYEPIQFWLDTPLEREARPGPAPVGEYPLAVTLRTSQEALAPIALQVQSIRAEADNLVFDLGFTNIGSRGLELLAGPTGSDAWLLDAEGSQYRPVAVSQSLANSIDPDRGWQPQQIYRGSITFPRPQAMHELRFIFPQYDALTLHFDTAGLTDARVTSSTGGPPPPTPTLVPEEQLVTDLNDLLLQEASALMAADLETYLDLFVPDLHLQQQAVFSQARQMPLATYELRIGSGQNVSAGADTLENIPVTIRYTLTGLPKNQLFEHTVWYSFSRTNDSWQTSAVEPTQNPPFWWNGPVTYRHTDHFLIIARPETADELPVVAEEAEAAYTTLVERGLPLAPRYVAYFSASQDDFQALTSQRSQVVGAATWRYNLDSAEITVTSRAFYINGEAFTGGESAPDAAERQATIEHELVHLALADHTRPFTPSWLTEGMAVYFSGQNSPEAVHRLYESGHARGIRLEVLTRDSSLGAHDFTGPLAEYQYIFAGEVINYLVDAFGEEQVLAFYRSYAEVPAAEVRAEMPRFAVGSRAMEVAFADLSETFTTQAVQRFFDMSLAGLDAEVKEWLEDQ